VQPAVHAASAGSRPLRSVAQMAYASPRNDPAGGLISTPRRASRAAAELQSALSSPARVWQAASTAARGTLSTDATEMLAEQVAQTARDFDQALRLYGHRGYHGGAVRTSSKSSSHHLWLRGVHRNDLDRQEKAKSPAPSVQLGSRSSRAPGTSSPAPAVQLGSRSSRAPGTSALKPQNIGSDPKPAAPPVARSWEELALRAGLEPENGQGTVQVPVKDDNESANMVQERWDAMDTLQDGDQDDGMSQPGTSEPALGNAQTGSKSQGPPDELLSLLAKLQSMASLHAKELLVHQHAQLLARESARLRVHGAADFHQKVGQPPPPPPPPPQSGPPAAPASPPPPPPDAHLNEIEIAGAKRMHKQHVGTVVEEVQKVGGSKALKKVNRAELLLNKRKSHKQETPLEHIRMKRLEMELRHKEKMGRAMKKIKVMNMMRKLGVGDGSKTLTAPPLRSAKAGTSGTSASTGTSTKALSTEEMTRRLNKKEEKMGRAMKKIKATNMMRKLAAGDGSKTLTAATR
jgi:hypothetical protein